jgi:hypothetical protein
MDMQESQGMKMAAKKALQAKRTQLMISLKIRELN